MDFGRKRGRPDAAFSGHGGFKRSKDEFDSFTTGVGSKSKPCTKFFSTAGCSFGSKCHFQHYFPGYNAHIQLANNSVGNPASISVARNSSFTGDNPYPSFKIKICNKINTPEGCRYGEKCRFAHSETEIANKPRNPIYQDPQRMTVPMDGYSKQFEPPQHGLRGGSFGLSATAKISVDASYAGAIIGKNGINSKQICHQTGVRFSIKDHDTDSSKRNIELEGSFDQIKEASSMVRELIGNITAATGGVAQNTSLLGRGGSRGNYYKRRMCEKFAMGFCTFGDRCHFAHSASELRNQFA